MIVIMFTPPVFATSIVAARTSSEVVLGADSRGLFDDGRAVTYRNVCKIHARNDIFFAISGLEVDPLTGFNAGRIVEDQIGTLKLVSVLVPKIERILADKLSEELEWQRKQRPDLYRRTVENNGLALAIVVVGLEIRHLFSMHVPLCPMGQYFEKTIPVANSLFGLARQMR